MKAHATRLAVFFTVAILAVVGYGILSPDAEGRIPPKDDGICYNASLTITSPFHTGWNEESGTTSSSCDAKLACMTDYADSQGWTYTNAGCSISMNACNSIERGCTP